MQLHLRVIFFFLTFLTIFLLFFILSIMINGNIALIDSGIGGLNLLYALDEKLNEKGYIVPGLGDAGDRIFGTK